ncbi:O-antigen ligase family protein [Luteitalea sp.]
MSRRTRQPQPRPVTPAATVARHVPAPRHQRGAFVLLVALLLVTPFVVVPDAKEGFRSIKTLLAGWLALASLIAASGGLRTGTPADWHRLLDRPLVRTVVPLLVVVLAGGLWTAHPAHFTDAATDVVIAGVAGVGWSLALPAPWLRRAVWWSCGASVAVALLTLDQAAGFIGVLDGLGVSAPTARLRLTSTLGNPGDVGASLVLPLLMVAGAHREAVGRWRVALGAGAAAMVAALVATATLAAIVALAAGLVALASMRTGLRGIATRRTVVAIGATIALGLAVPGVRARLDGVVGAARSGDWNAMLTGRLDGWRAAVAMLRGHPLTGVGQGGYRAEYAEVRLALMERGVPFFDLQTQVMFDTPHNEYLSVAAEQGWPGVVVLACGVWSLGVAAWRLRRGDDQSLAVAGLVALATLALGWFPLHVAAVAWPWVVWLAWLDRTAMEAQS